MSYETLEGLLVKRIAEIRASEAQILRSVEESGRGAQRSMSSEHTRLQAKIADVETLLAAMDGQLMMSACA